VSEENPDYLQLPLQPILAAMAMDLRAKVMQAPPADAIISLPLDKILTQLAFGSVKITFGELRQAVPGVFVNSGGEHDHKTVTLPLNEILTRLNPAKLSRRPVQKHLEVAEDINGPFGAGAQGVKISANTRPTPSTSMTSRTDTSRTEASPLRVVAPTAPAPSQPAPSRPAPVAPLPVDLPPPVFVPRAITPAASVTTPPPPSLTTHDTTHINNLGTPRSNGNGVVKPFVPAPPVAPPAPPAAVPLPPMATAPAAPAPAESNAIFAPLKALSEQWPEGLRLEIIQSDLANAQVLLPMNVIEPALKRGRITFTWRNLRALIKPAPTAPSVHDAIELELPLSVIAPLFFTRQKAAGRTPSTAQPPADIPNLFFGFPQAESSQPQPPAKTPTPQAIQPLPVRPTPPEPQPIQPQPIQPQPIRPLPAEPQLPRSTAPEPQPIQPLPESRPARPAPKPVDTKLADSNYYIWGDDTEILRADETEYKHKQKPSTDFTSRYATPKEIVERAKALAGVVGVVVALPDGLRVASQVPPEFNADTLAAFLPQIFDRVNQSTKELRMGALNNFNFTVGNVPWRIFRVNAVYFAAFGCAGEALPSAQLAALAAELDRKK
jgi:predicted regulator of Ras-like GTPase activity (Roadblock/LC7/MglB family)